MKKTILVTGASGFIGLNIVKKLISSDEVEKIIAVVRTDRKYIYDNILSNPKVKVINADLTNKEKCFEVTKNVDQAILAGAVSFGASFIQNNPLDLVNDNIVMNVLILDACHKNGVKNIVYFGSTTGYPDSEEVMKEEDMFLGDPFDRYFSVGWMKRYTEVLMRLYAEKLKLMNCTVLRLSNVYGPYDKFDLQTSHVLPAMVRKFCEKRFPLEIWGDGEDSRDLIYVDDVVSAVIKSLNLTGYNVYNLGYGSNYTVNEIVKILSEINNITPEICYIKDKPRMIRKRLVSIDKIKRDLNFEPTVDITEGLKRTSLWLSDNIKNIYR